MRLGDVGHMKVHMAFYCVAPVLDASERGQLSRYFSGTKEKWVVIFLTIPANRLITHLASLTYKSKRFRIQREYAGTMVPFKAEGTSDRWHRFIIY